MISREEPSAPIPAPDSNFNELGIAETIIQFISWYLPDFKIKYELVKPHKQEGYYNVQLEDYFQRIAHQNNSIFYLSGNRLNKEVAYPDISVLKVKDDNHDSIFDIECKRLKSDLSHVKEYVFGKTGGIERFKRNLHGTDLPCSAMIGYVENQTKDFWINKINKWLKEQNEIDSTFWTANEYLIETEKEYFQSKHHRIDCASLSSIILFHFFHFIPEAEPEIFQ